MKNVSRSFRLFGVLLCFAMIFPLVLTMAYSVIVLAADIHTGEQTANYMPSDIDAYATVNLRPGVQQGLMFKDIMNEWWEYTGTQGTMQELMDQINSDSGIDIQNDILSWLGPEIAAGVKGLGSVDQPPEFVVFVGTTDNVASYNFFFDKFLPMAMQGATPPTEPNGVYRGIDILTLPEDSPYCAFVDEYIADSYIIVSTSEVLFYDCLDLVAGDPDPSLADASGFQAAQANLPKPMGLGDVEEERTAMVYFNCGAVWQQLVDRVAGTPDESLLDLYTPYVPDFAALSASFVDKGIKLDFYSPTPAALDVSPLMPAPLNAAGIIPGDADAVFSIKDISGEWEVIKDLAGDNWADLDTLSDAGDDWPADPASFMQLLDTNWGFNPDEDLFSWLTDECTLVQMPYQGLNLLDGPPDALLFLQVGDEAAARQKVEGIIATINQQLVREAFPWQTVSPLEIQQEQIGGVPVTFVTNSPIEASGASPGYLFLDNSLVIGTSRDALSAVVVTHSHPELSLAQTPEFQWMTSRLGAENNDMAYVNGSRFMDYVLTRMDAYQRSEFSEQILPFLDPLRSAGLSISMGQDAIRGSMILHVDRTAGTLVEGQVRLQGCLEHDGATVGVGSQQAASNFLGQFSLGSVPTTGQVTATASMPGFLTARRTGVTSTDGTRTSLGAVTLIAGDVSGDGVINAADLSAMGSAFNSSPPSAEAADINQDGIVDVYDLVWVGQNQGKSGHTPWLPDPSDGVISGFIQGSDGSPIADAHVTASGIDTYRHSGSRTYSDGSYVLEGLPEGSYRIIGDAPGYFARQTATAVTVGSAQETPNINLTLQLGGSISGHVYDSSGTNPLANASVTVYDATNHSEVQRGYTASDGSYRVAELPSGSYDLRAGQIGYLPEFYQGQTTLAAATPVPVTIGQETPNIDFTLDPGGSISGKVYDSQNHPLSGASIAVYDANTHKQVRSAYTDSNGGYKTGGAGLPSGSYHVRASPYGYVPEYYDNATTIETAAEVTLTAPNEYTNVNFTLDPMASVSGHVHDSTGTSALSAMRVYVFDADTHNYVRSAYTTDDGSYKVQALPDGSYHVVAYRYGYPYLPEWYYESANWDSATVLTLTAPNEYINVNFTLDLGGSISGHVYKPDGRPLDGAVITVYTSPDSDPVASGRTNWYGRYEVGGLPTGSYYVKADGYGYAEEFYQDAGPDTATLVSVTLSQETSGIDFTLDVGGYVSGYVYDSQGRPLSGAYIGVYDSTSHYEVASGRTGSDGSYIAVGLPTGSYDVSASRNGCLEYYDEVATLADATSVSATIGQRTPNINFALDQPGIISGTVRDSQGNTVSEANVVVYDSATHQKVRSIRAAGDGSYSVEGLPIGSYHVRALCSGFFDEYYQDATTIDTAQSISVALNQDTQDIDFTLSLIS